MPIKKYSMEQFDSFAEKIFPIIKVDISDQEKSVGTISIDFNQEEEPIHMTLVGDLILFLGIDRGDNYELIQRNKFDFSVEDSALYKIAFDNLSNFLEDKIQVVDTKIGCKMLICGYDFEAAAIQMDWIKKQLLNLYGPKLVVGIVSKDLVLIANESEKDIIRNMEKEISEIHSNGEKLLSKKLFLLEGNKLSLYYT